MNDESATEILVDMIQRPALCIQTLPYGYHDAQALPITAAALDRIGTHIHVLFDAVYHL